LNEEERQRIVKAGLSKFSFNKPQKRSPDDDLIDRAMSITTALREHIRPILQAGGGKDKPALRALITTCYLEAFSKLHKDDLIRLCALLHMEAMIESIETDIYGSGKPDALS